MARLPKCPLCGAKCVVQWQSWVKCPNADARRKEPCPYFLVPTHIHRAICAKLKAARPKGKVLARGWRDARQKGGYVCANRCRHRTPGGCDCQPVLIVADPAGKKGAKT